MPAATRQAKRPFQPSITSYFSTADADSFSPPRPPRTQSAPALPATIQSSLLNVGMRIRKSVPEGYKTGSSCYTLGPGEDKTPSHRVPTRTSASQTSGGDRRLAELTPYCGIMKVGGYATQQNDSDWSWMSRAKQINEAIVSDNFPGSGQESTISADSVPAGDAQPVNPQKRRLDDDDDKENFDEPRRIDNISESLFIHEDDATVPTTSLANYPVSHTATPNLSLTLPLAQSRSQLRSHHIAIRRPATFFFGNEENMGVDVRTAPLLPSGADFEEADFLQPHTWAEGEVEMSGL